MLLSSKNVLRKNFLKMLEESLRIPKKAIDLLFGIKKNNVILTNAFVLLLTHFAYYPVRIFKPLHVKKFSLTSIFSSNIIKFHLSKQ